jgi:hypothetical protein
MAWNPAAADEQASNFLDQERLLHYHQFYTMPQRNGHASSVTTHGRFKLFTCPNWLEILIVITLTITSKAGAQIQKT